MSALKKDEVPTETGNFSQDNPLILPQILINLTMLDWERLFVFFKDLNWAKPWSKWSGLEKRLYLW